MVPLAGDLARSVVEGVSGVLDSLITSDEERGKIEIAMKQIEQLPALRQLDVNEQEAAHPSIFVAGWRPAVGWVCVVGLGWSTLLHPILEWAATYSVIWGFSDQLVDFPVPDVAGLLTLLGGMLGLGYMRSREKTEGVARENLKQTRRPTFFPKSQ